MMLAAARRSRILDELHRTGTVRVADLAERLHVSDMTIRRDLEVLAGKGALAKVHGGATVIAPRAEEPGFAAKSDRQQAEKIAIARLAATLVTPGSAIGLSAGTTTWALANELRDVPELTVVTNSIRVADVFHAAATPGTSTMLTGGMRTPSDALVGPIAVSALGQLHLDLVFLGVHGMDVQAGLTTPNLLEAETDRAMAAAGQQLVVVADHTKWRTVGLCTIAPLDQAAVLVSDDGLAAEARATLEEHVGELMTADPREGVR